MDFSYSSCVVFSGCFYSLSKCIWTNILVDYLKVWYNNSVTKYILVLFHIQETITYWLSRLLGLRHANRCSFVYDVCRYVLSLPSTSYCNGLHRHSTPSLLPAKVKRNITLKRTKSGK